MLKIYNLFFDLPSEIHAPVASLTFSTEVSF